MQALWIILGVIGAGLVGYTIYDVVRVLSIKIRPSNPIQEGKKITPIGLATLYQYLGNPNSIPSEIEFSEEFILNQLESQLEYIDKRYDCADFFCTMLLMIYKEYKEKLPASAIAKIENSFLNFKFWSDMPEEESLCFFSENHTIIFTTLEILCGEMWQDRTFKNSGLTGKKHMERGISRFNCWVDQKLKYGFFEWYSNNYWSEDLGPLCNLVSYVKDKEVKQKAKQCLDLMWFEVFTHSTEGRFMMASSRQYGDNKGYPLHANRLQPVMDYILKGDQNFDAIESCTRAQIDVCMVACQLQALKKVAYTVPQIFKDLAQDSTEQVIKTSHGLDTFEYEKLGLMEDNEYGELARMSNFAFVNKGFAQKAFEHHKRNKAFASAFAEPFRFADIFPIRTLKLLPLMCNVLDKYFVPTGSFLARGNIYTYKNNGYLMSTACNCFVDYFGNQQHTGSLCISDDINIYTHYPPTITRLANAPGYWGGQKRMPMAVQEKGTSIVLYKVDKKQRLGEGKPHNLTHVLFPTEKFDEYTLNGNYIVAKKGETYVAVICNSPMQFKDYNIEEALAVVAHDQSHIKATKPQSGLEKYLYTKDFDLASYGYGYRAYITEVSDSTKETYQDFAKRVSQSTISVTQNGQAIYNDTINTYEVNYGGSFKLNNQPISLDFPRYQSDFCNVSRFEKDMTIDYKGEKYYI